MKKLKTLLFIFPYIIFLTVDPQHSAKLDSENRKYGRLENFSIYKLGFINLFRIENKPCAVNTTAYPQGICYARQQCKKMGGEAMTTCYSGFGVCCVFQRSCNQTIENSNTYFVNPNYPSALQGAKNCLVQIAPLSSAVIQIRIELEEMILMQPVNGDCSKDKLEIKYGENQTVVLCGVNTGQHVYVHLTNTSSLKVVISTSSDLFERKWRIRFKQLTNKHNLTAPSRCLQYFPSKSGTISSFNQHNNEGQLINQRCYGICFPYRNDACSIKFEKKLFKLGANKNETCDDRFLGIDYEKHCTDQQGNNNFSVSSYGPVVLIVCSGQLSKPAVGFRINYEMESCN